MARFFGNILKTLGYLSVAGLIGFYNFEKNGMLGVVTNGAFLIIGMLLVLAWGPTKKPSVDGSETRPSSVTGFNAVFVGNPEEIAKAAKSTANGTAPTSPLST